MASVTRFLYAFIYFFAYFIPMSGDSTADPSSMENSINVGASAGNSSINIMKKGLMAVQDDWMYYAVISFDPEEDSGLYRAKIDGSQSEKLLDGKFDSINIVGDLLYFVENETSGHFHLYCTGLTNMDKTILIEDCGYALVTNGGIYYSKYYGADTMYDSGYPSDLGHICSADLDGGNQKVLIDKMATTYLLCGDYLYYFISNEIWRYHFPSGDSEKIASGGNSYEEYNDGSGVYFLNDNMLYFIDGGMSVKAMNLETKETVTILEEQEKAIDLDAFDRISPYENRLIYNYIYAADLDGNNKEKLFDRSFGINEIYSFDDVYYAWGYNWSTPRLLDELMIH